MSPKSQTEHFVHDRVAEIKHFITEMRREYKDKCSSDQWRSILRQAHRDLERRLDNEHLGDP